MVSETRKQSMVWMQHGLQIRLKTCALSMEDPDKGGWSFGRAINYGWDGPFEMIRASLLFHKKYHLFLFLNAVYTLKIFYQQVTGVNLVLHQLSIDPVLRQYESFGEFSFLSHVLAAWSAFCALFSWSRRTTCAKDHGLFYLYYPQIKDVWKSDHMTVSLPFRQECRALGQVKQQHLKHNKTKSHG